jgi:uncharacterized protein YqjF (DUF2071 family)
MSDMGSQPANVRGMTRLGPWLVAQSWEDLLLAHWRVPVEAVRRLLPEHLSLDIFEGQAWISIVPFRMSGIHAHWLPPLPGLSASPELNLRTYVSLDGRPGIFFFSLDVANRAAVPFGRLVYHLPYFRARMSVRYERSPGPSPSAPDRGDEVARTAVHYACTRADACGERVSFRGSYRPSGPVFRTAPGSLDDWLTARLCLYAVDGKGSIYRTDIAHRPWPLQPAEAEIELNTMTAPLGLTLAGPPLLHFARRLDVRIWPPCHLGDSGPRTQDSGGSDPRR